MTILEAVILGIVQGLAEFLPISSSGHLLVMQHIFGIKDPTMSFDVLLHIGTLIPVIIVYRNDLSALLKNPFQKMTYLLIIGTLPAVAAALIFNDYIDYIFGGTKFLALGFFVTGCILLYADRVSHGRKKTSDITYLDAVIIGCVQAIAILPAISRSGSTVSASLHRKLNREAAAKFSFLLSVPAILGAAVLEITKMLAGKDTTGSIGMMPLVFGFLSAMLTGYLAITFMLKIIKDGKLSYFSYYVFILGAAILLDQYVTHLFL